MAEGEQTQGTSPAGGPAAVPGQAPGGGSPGTADSGAAALPAGGASAVAAGPPGQPGSPSPEPSGAAATQGQTDRPKVDPWAALEREKARTKGLQPLAQEYQERTKRLTEVLGENWYDTILAAAESRAGNRNAPSPTTQPQAPAQAPQQVPSLQQAAAHANAGYEIPQNVRAYFIKQASDTFNADAWADGTPITQSDRERMARDFEVGLRALGVTDAEMPFRPTMRAQVVQAAPQAPHERPMTPVEIEEQIKAEHRAERQFRSELEALASPKELGADWFAQQVEYDGERMSRKEAIEVYCDTQRALHRQYLHPVEAINKLWPRDLIDRIRDVSTQQARVNLGALHVGMPGGGVAPAELSPASQKAMEDFARARGLVTDTLTTKKPSWMGRDERIFPTNAV